MSNAFESLFELVAMLAYCAAATRILFCKRKSARFRPFPAIQAWLLTVVLIGSAMDLFFDPVEVRFFDALRAVFIAVCIFYAGVNVSWMLRRSHSKNIG